MRPLTCLRIASVLALAHAVLHTASGVYGTLPGAASVAEAAMKANQFQLLGVTRTLWDLHRGMGLAVTIFLTAEGLVFWLLGSLVKRDGAALRPILLVFLLAYCAFAVVSIVYFFALPVIFEALIALFLGLALAGARTETTAH
jgi:hypothetical protein